jgi:hypothetical protein
VVRTADLSAFLHGTLDTGKVTRIAGYSGEKIGMEGWSGDEYLVYSVLHRGRLFGGVVDLKTRRNYFIDQCLYDYKHTCIIQSIRDDQDLNILRENLKGGRLLECGPDYGGCVESYIKAKKIVIGK